MTCQPENRPTQVVMDDAEKEMVAEAAALDAPAQPPPVHAAVVVEDEDDDQPIKIVKNYTRVVCIWDCHCVACASLYDVVPNRNIQAQKPSTQSYDPTKYVVSPITGELIPLADMEEHMRVSLIDPRWREQREAMIAKIRDTTRADDDEIARNLVGLARTRPDIFGMYRGLCTCSIPVTTTTAPRRLNQRGGAVDGAAVDQGHQNQWI